MFSIKRMQVFESGVMVLQLQSHNEAEIVKLTEASVSVAFSFTYPSLYVMIYLDDFAPHPCHAIMYLFPVFTALGFVPTPFLHFVMY